MLRPLQAIFPEEDYPDLLVGLGAPDDAAVWRLDDSRAMVVTTDFFTPVVDDPYDFGAIAAVNALSDLYAMGSIPILALNITAFPPKLPAEVLSEILRGGAEMVKQSGAVIAGGHTIQDDEPKYGLVAIGIGDLDRLITKDRAEVGDILILTKPLGTGVTTTALRNGAATDEDVQQAVQWMTRLNAAASQIAIDFEVRAGTDVTGFGLLGHAAEMAELSGVGLRLFLPSIPFLSGVRLYAEGGHFPGGSADNRLFFGRRVQFDESIDEYNQMLLFDAQTSGGLLVSLSAEKLEPFMEKASTLGIDVWPIGIVEEGKGLRVVETLFPDYPPPPAKLWFVSPP